ncbi:MAG: hypothetical protein AB8I08_13600 [Sandaracinaceae bacterium]
MRPRLPLLALLVSSLLPSPASAQATAVANQRLVGVINPIGAEHMVSAGLRAPLGLPDGILYSDTHIELGPVSYVSPIYARTGGYLQLQPLAVLILRAEVRHVAMWSLDMPGAGYVPVEPGRGQGQAGEALGWEAQFSAIVQGMVPLGPVQLLLWDQVGYERIHLGVAPRYLSPRHDTELAREDGVMSNSAMLLGQVELSEGWSLRVGAYDDVAYVPSSDTLIHQVGPIAALSISRPADGVAEVMPLLRAGYYTDGRREGAWTGLAGVMISYR